MPAAACSYVCVFIYQILQHRHMHIPNNNMHIISKTSKKLAYFTTVQYIFL